MSNIINYDIQGWPIYKLSLRDIIKTFMNYNPVDKAYWIKENDPVLDKFPLILEDDGMGYGINDKYICEFNPNKEHQEIPATTFVETPLDKSTLTLWNKAEFHPGDIVTCGGTSIYKVLLILEENNKIIYRCTKYKKVKSGNSKKLFKWKDNIYKEVKIVSKFEDELYG